MTNSATPPPSASSKMFLLVAVALGILATVLAFVFIQSGANANSGPKIFVTVAKHDISPNTPIDPERDLRQEPIPSNFAKLRDRTLDWAARANYKGQRVNRDIRADQPVMLADFAAVGDLVLNDGFLALTLPADTGMIIPGDRIRVIVAKPPVAATTMTAAPAFDATIIGPKEGFKVLAVGGYLYKTRSQVTASDQYNANAAGQKSVTLEVTEDQAKQLVGALNGMNNGQKATLLICPSDLTRSQTAENKP